MSFFDLQIDEEIKCENPLPGADHILAQHLKGRSSSSAALIETIQPIRDRQNTRLSFLARQTDIRLRLQNFLCEPMKVAEISRVLFASRSNKPKRRKKCDEFKSLYRNILKLLFCGHISLLQEKQHHFKFHLTWTRGTQFGEGLVLAMHLSESVSPFARSVRLWQRIYSTAQGSEL